MWNSGSQYLHRYNICTALQTDAQLQEFTDDMTVKLKLGLCQLG